VTGVGAGNMGERIAIELALNGMRIHLVGRSEQKTREAAVRFEAETKIKPEWTAADLLKLCAEGPKGFRWFVHEIGKKTGRIHVLVHAAGFVRSAGFLETDSNLYDTTFDINLKAPFFITQEMIRSGYLKEGVVINISSTVGEPTHGWSGGMVYSMSKAALTLWGQMLASECAPSIRVNTVLPGSIETPMTDALLHTEGKRRMARSIPLGRLGRCEEIASVVLALVANEYLSGTEIRVDGARTVGP